MGQIDAQIKVYIREIKDEFRKSDFKRKLLIILLCAMAVVGVYLVIGSILGILYWVLGMRGQSFIYLGCFNALGMIPSAIGTFLVLRHIWRVGTPSDLRNETLDQDENGTTYNGKSVKGSAYKMKAAEASEQFEVCGMDESYNVVFGTLDSGAKESVRIRPSKYGGELRNILLCGPSGTQKSRCFVRNEVINSTLRGESACFTDPSLELYTEFNTWCRERAEVYCINFKDPEHSDGWNCLKETVNPSTERVDPTRLNTFSSVFINNCDAGRKEDPYWYTQANNYLKATIGYIAWKHEDYIVKKLKRLFLKVAEDMPKAELQQITAGFSGLCSIPWCKQQIITAGVARGYSRQKMEEAFQLIEKQAPKYNIQEVTKALKNFKDVEKAYKCERTDPGFIPDEQVGKEAFRTVTMEGQSDNAKSSGIITTLGKLSLFTDPMLTYNLSRDGINLREFNSKQTVCFVGMPDGSTELQPITSLFFTFLFNDTQDNYDRANQIAKDHKEKNPTLDTNIILDDFFSIGVIGGDPTQFTTYMSNARKRHLYITMIIQDMSQLKTRYGDTNYNTIISNSAYQVCFGAADPVSMEYFSKMTGIATTVKVTEHRTDGFFQWQSPDLAITSDQRNLYNADEVWSLPEDKCIVIKAHKRPLELFKVSYEHNPVYINGELEDESVYRNIASYYEKMEKERQDEMNKLNDSDLERYINSLTPSFSVNEDGEVSAFIAVTPELLKKYSAYGRLLSGRIPTEPEAEPEEEMTVEHTEEIDTANPADAITPIESDRQAQEINTSVNQQTHKSSSDKKSTRIRTQQKTQSHSSVNARYKNTASVFND